MCFLQFGLDHTLTTGVIRYEFHEVLKHLGRELVLFEGLEIRPSITSFKTMLLLEMSPWFILTFFKMLMTWSFL